MKKKTTKVAAAPARAAAAKKKPRRRAAAPAPHISTTFVLRAAVTDEQLAAMFWDPRPDFNRPNIVVNDGGCWVWQGPLTDTGLPKFGFCPEGPARLSPKVPMAHRTAWFWFRGLLLPYPHWKIDQKCGVRACINPAHLRQVRVPQKGELEISTARLASVFEHVTVIEKTGCWYWTGSINASGYATNRFDDGTLRAVDGVLFLWFVGYGEGQAPHDFQLFHKCMSRACVNPSHMTLVTHGQRWTAERIAAGEQPPPTSLPGEHRKTS